MKNVLFTDAVKAFLSTRGIVVESASFRLDSLDYLALLLDLEATLDVNIDDGTFFSQGIPEMETLEYLCQRLASACA